MRINKLVLNRAKTKCICYIAYFPSNISSSLLPALSKIFEKIIFNQIFNYFSENDLLTNAQHAYRSGHSTNTALEHMTLAAFFLLLVSHVAVFSRSGRATDSAC